MQDSSNWLASDWLEFIALKLQLWAGVFTSDTLRYVIGVGITSFVLYSWLGVWSASRKIQARQASSQDIRREIKYSLMTTAVYAFAALFLIHALEQGYMQVYESVSDYGLLYTVISLPLILVLHDTYFYWAHRMMHHPKLFRWVHKAHHLSRTPTTWAAYSFAPPEALIMFMFTPLVMWLIPIHSGVYFIFLIIMILRNAQGHSGIEFHPKGWVDGPLDHITTITHHDMHHQKFNGNYGLYFTWWDRLMGTELPGYKAAFKDAVEGRKVVKPGDQASVVASRQGVVINSGASPISAIK